MPPLLLQYAAEDSTLHELILLPGLDQAIAQDAGVSAKADAVVSAVQGAMDLAYSCTQDEAAQRPEVEAAHIFLQRVLYRINRLNHFW
jgi:hypothetical protein